MKGSELKTLCIFGTRPEAIKMAPLALALAADERFDAKVCVTGQHREMLDQVLDLFAIKPDFDLSIMKLGQELTDELRESPARAITREIADMHPGTLLVVEPNIKALPAKLNRQHRLASLEDAQPAADIMVYWMTIENSKRSAAVLFVPNRLSIPVAPGLSE